MGVFDGQHGMVVILHRLAALRVADAIRVVLTEKAIGTPVQALRDIRRNEIMQNPRNDVVIEAGTIGKLAGPVSYRYDKGTDKLEFNVQFPGLHYPHFIDGDLLDDPA